MLSYQLTVKSLCVCFFNDFSYISAGSPCSSVAALISNLANSSSVTHTSSTLGRRQLFVPLSPSLSSLRPNVMALPSCTASMCLHSKASSFTSTVYTKDGQLQ